MMPGSVRADERARVSRFAAVLDRDEFRSELDRLCVSEWRWGAPQAVRFQPLKWHRERCTFEIAVKTETGWHRVIGKVYKRYKDTILTYARSKAPLPPGHWNVVLTIGGRIAKQMDVVLK